MKNRSSQCRRSAERVGRFHPEVWPFPYHLGVLAFRLLGLYKRGWKNACSIVHRELEWRVPHLPEGLSGLKLLFLSDLHLDGPVPTFEKLLDVLPDIEADVTLLGGDYHWNTFSFNEHVVDKLKALAPLLSRPLGAYAVLGNHDPPVLLEHDCGLEITFLANASVRLPLQTADLYVAGLEDCHLYMRHDCDAALAGIPAEAVTLLLSHALDVVPEAARRGCDLFLAGHTHWGQIALPGGIPVLTHSSPGRSFAAGFWSMGRMQGYTTSGAGTCGLPFRFNTKNEVVTLVLKKGASSDPS